MRAQKDDSHPQTKERGLGRRQRCQLLRPKCVDSRIGRKKFLSLKSPGLWCSLQQPWDTNTRPLSAPPSPTLHDMAAA